MTQQVFQELNKQLANLVVLNAKAREFHWYVTGEHFFTLHDQFEKIYQTTNEVIDELAERILYLGGKPLSKLQQFIEAASIHEKEEITSAKAMVQSITNDMEVIIREVSSLLQKGDIQNEPTVDLLVQLQKTLEGYVWKLKAFQQ
jgi:starvation-inducible DNA-binding protein